MSSAKLNVTSAASFSSANKKFYGLGDRYYKTLQDVVDNINQVDTVTGTTETNGSVNSRSIEIVVGLKKRNLKYMDIVVIVSRNHCEQTVVVLACLYIGAIICPLEQGLSYLDYLNYIKLLQPKIVFCDSTEATLLEKVIQKSNISCEVIVFDKTHTRCCTFWKLQAEKEANFSPVQIIHPRSTVAFILPACDACQEYKLVCLSHTSIYLQTKNFLQCVQISKRYMSYYKFCSIIEVILMCSSFEKPLTRILPRRFTGKSACRFLHDMRVDYAFMESENLINLIESPASRNNSLSSVKSILIGGKLPSGQDITYIRNLLKNIKIIKFYATSEAGIISLTSDADYEMSLDRPTTVGKPMSGTDVEILDVENKTYLPAYAFGEILVTGNGVMMGYFKDQVSSAYLVHHHFLRTGDFGELDSEGWLYVYGRLDELTVRDTVSYCPNEIEDLLKRHPHVDDVALIGDKNDLIACITVKDNTQLNTENLLKFLDENSEILSEKPSKVIVMCSFPRTPVGKVKKIELMKQYFASNLEFTDSSTIINKIPLN